MLFSGLDSRLSRIIRLLGLALVSWSLIGASHDAPGVAGRRLVVTILFAVCVVAVLAWLRIRDADAPIAVDTWVLALAGGALIGASPYSAASAFAFVAIITAGVRRGSATALQVAAAAAVALAVTTIVWDEVSAGLLAYVLGFAAAAFAGGNARQIRQRAEEAELLLAQTQRSQEESLRAARLEESTRIAREIHDLLAHSLAGLTIQLEATTALIEAGADRDEILARVRRAHELARDGQRETRRAVGALRGDGPSVPEAIEALAAEHPARLQLAGDRSRLRGDAGHAVLRVVQEALTNVAKHAPGAEVSIAIDAGPEMVVVVENRAPAAVAVGDPAGSRGDLSDSGGGYGIEGMRERAVALAGTLSAEPIGDGWRVELRIPAAGAGDE